MAMVDACFALLLELISEQPRDPALPATTGLRRELLHRLCAAGAAGCSHARLAESARIARRQTMVESDFFSAEEVDAEIKAMAEFKENADPMQPGRYVLREEHISAYDPHYFHLSRKEHEHARDFAENIRKKSRDLERPRPCVLPPSEPHAFFAATHRLLQSPRLHIMWRGVVTEALKATSSEKPEGAEDEDEPPKPAVTDATIDATMQLITIALHCEPAPDAGGRRALHAAFESGTTLKHRPTQPGPEGDTCLLLLLHQLREAVAEDNPSLCESISWIVAQLVEQDEGCAERLRQVAASSGEAEDAKETAEERRKRSKEEAQRRAMEQMQKMQMSFLDGMDSSDDDDEEEPAGVAAVVNSAAASETSADAEADDGEEGFDAIGSLPECALSHEASEPGRVVGFMAFAQRSCVASGTPARGGVCIHFYAHALHFERYYHYHASLVDKKEHNEMHEGMHSVNLSRGEFLSPVCKSIANLLIPAVVNGATAIRAAAAAATAAPGEADGLPENFLREVDFRTAFDGSRGGQVDGGECDSDHTDRTLEKLYELSNRSHMRRNVLTLVEQGAETISYTLEAMEMQMRVQRDLDDGDGAAVWPPQQLAQMRNLFDAVRMYASREHPLFSLVRRQLADVLVSPPPPGCWGGISSEEMESQARAAAGNHEETLNSLFGAGDCVMLHGLMRAPQLNGKTGVVQEFDAAKGRFVCKVEGVEKVVAAKPANIVRCSPAFCPEWPGAKPTPPAGDLIGRDMLRLLAVCAVYLHSRSDLLRLARTFFVARLVQICLDPTRVPALEIQPEPEQPAEMDIDAAGAADRELCETAQRARELIGREEKDKAGGDGEEGAPSAAWRGALGIESLRAACLPFLRHAIMLVDHVGLRLGDELAPAGFPAQEEYAWCLARTFACLIHFDLERA